MEYTSLGPTNHMVPKIGFGTARYRGNPGVLGRAIQLGANLIDTAESYNAFGNEPGVAERIVGRELKAVARPAFVATKISANNLRYDDVIEHAAQPLSSNFGRLDVFPPNDIAVGRLQYRIGSRRRFLAKSQERQHFLIFRTWADIT